MIQFVSMLINQNTSNKCGRNLFLRIALIRYSNKPKITHSFIKIAFKKQLAFFAKKRLIQLYSHTVKQDQERLIRSLVANLKIRKAL